MRASFQAELYKIFKLRELFWLLGILCTIALILGLGQIGLAREEFGYFWTDAASNRWLAVVNLKFSTFGFLYPLLFGIFAAWVVYYEYKDHTYSRFPLLPSSSFEQFSAKYWSLSFSALMISLLSALLFPLSLLIFNWNNDYLLESRIPRLELFSLSLFLMLKVFLCTQGFMAIIFLISFFIKKLIISIGITFFTWLAGLMTLLGFFPSNLPIKTIIGRQRQLSAGSHMENLSFKAELTSLVFLLLVFLIAYIYFRKNHLYKF